MKSYNCFKDCLKDLLPLFEELQKTYFAHLSRDKSENESLFEHSELVADYCLKLIEAHGLEKVFNATIDKLIQSLPVTNEEKFGNLFKEVFLAAIVYHDLGKVNPNFQVLKMENDLFIQNKKLSFQSNHSLLGAYLFSNIFFKRTFEKEISDDEKLILYFTVLLFAGAIVKHHNPTINLSLDFDIQQLDDCYPFLETYRIFLEESFCSSFYQGANDIFSEFRNLVDRQEVYFDLFASTKLLYSLLTASDFYATNEFMSKVKEFGILGSEEKEKLIERFKTVQPYNKDLYSNLEYYQSVPFEQLRGRNNQNLNILRQKLTAEMIFNLRNHSTNHCFYIEAPTGAGKTNLSLAFATELLNMDSSINKVFYVFPFTTLITQTFKSIKDTLKIDNNTIQNPDFMKKVMVLMEMKNDYSLTTCL